MSKKARELTEEEKKGIERATDPFQLKEQADAIQRGLESFLSSAGLRKKDETASKYGSKSKPTTPREVVVGDDRGAVNERRASIGPSPDYSKFKYSDQKVNRDQKAPKEQPSDDPGYTMQYGADEKWEKMVEQVKKNNPSPTQSLEEDPSAEFEAAAKSSTPEVLTSDDIKEQLKKRYLERMKRQGE